MTHHLPSSQMIIKKTPYGYRSEATKTNFPLLKGMSFYKLALETYAVREPHWHANANELGYCLKGKVLVSFYKSGNETHSFQVNTGETFFVPSGSLHAVENLHSDLSEVILQFSHEQPEDFALSSTFGMFTNAVLGNTWGVLSERFETLKRPQEVFMAKRNPLPVVNSHYPSPYHYDLEGAFPLISNEGGYVKVARRNTWPILSNAALYSLHLTNVGMREPHWHPETAEMGYVNQGKARMSILSPSGKIDTYEINEGDLYFIPKAYPHHIENLLDGPLHLLIFFDQSSPQDIGFTGAVKSFSNDLLTAVFNCPENFFSSLPTYYQDLLIVKRVNPLD